MATASGILKLAGGANPIIGGAATLAGGLLANRSSKKQASKNRRFQQFMSSTAHQREVKDLRLAGLNPILSATGGGASGATGSTPNIVDTVGNAVHSALAVRKAEAEIANIKASTANTKTSTAQTQNTIDTGQLDADVGDDMAHVYQWLRSKVLNSPSTGKNVMNQIFGSQSPFRNNRYPPGNAPRQSFYIDPGNSRTPD